MSSRQTSAKAAHRIDDVAAGYNNLPTDREYVMCAWDDKANAARFYTSRVMMFGSTASVNHFCRLPALIERIGARLFGTLARAYVDDWVITDFAAAVDSAQQVLAAVHSDIGIPLAACQHACCSQCNRNPRSDPPPLCRSVNANAPARFRSCWESYATSHKRAQAQSVTLPNPRAAPRCSGN